MNPRATLLSASIRVDRDSSTPLHRQLCVAIRQAIENGSLAHGARLPSSRKVATALGVSRNTVLQAYEALGAEGLVEGVRGSGTRVCAKLRRLRVQIPPSRLDWRRILREARFPSRVVLFEDPEGNPIYFGF